jgi:hypothetical protein
MNASDVNEVDTFDFQTWFIDQVPPDSPSNGSVDYVHNIVFEEEWREDGPVGRSRKSKRINNSYSFYI